MERELSVGNDFVFSRCVGRVWSIIVKVKVAQSYPTLCGPMDYTVPGILQSRILE